MLIFSALSVCGCSGSQSTAPAQPSLPATHVLQHGDLVVEVMDPDDPLRYNRGVRFTPMAAVLSAQLHGKEFLYHPAAHDAINDHGGLASEFDLINPGDTSPLMPPGYAEAAAGGGFLKIGVGVLQRQAERYTFFQLPTVISQPHTEVAWRADSASFHQTCPATNGYGYELWAELSIDDRSITVDWRLANRGTKPLTTRNYTHNFFRLADQDVGPGYVLQFPYEFQATGLKPQQQQVGNEIRIVQPIPKPLNAVIPWPADYQGSNSCTLRNVETGQSILCKTSVPGLFTALHTRPQYISPEQFIELKIAPAQHATWRREYRLECRNVAP